MTRPILKTLAAVAAFLALAGCDQRPPVQSAQSGYRGTGMAAVSNPRKEEAKRAANVVPVATPQAPPGGPKARDVMQNVQVLGDLDVAQFTRLMAAMTQWISPKEGCAYCHATENLADDGKYTKVVARRMLQMTMDINANWQPHVAQTGVTCFTCHRGNHIPQKVWSKPEPQARPAYAGARNGQNQPAPGVGLSSLPSDPFSTFLLGSTEIRVQEQRALQQTVGGTGGLPKAEHTHGLMIHMSESLGVNCTTCHNSRDFADWSQSTPQRATAWHGIRMARQVNNTYMEPLASVFPAERKGPMGDTLKVNCATCHQGANKPLLGVSMLGDYPELKGPAAAK